DYLPMHFQKSILSALSRKRHRGVLTGAPLTDVKIILTAGKGSNKHTEGGDFYQASQRAVRQGLMKAECVLLEPWCSYELIIPSASLSRALFELETFGCTMETQDLGSSMKITGKGPLRLLMHYQNDVTAYTKGRGRFQVQPEGYDVCTEAEKIVEETMYDPEADLRNPTGSVFCAHGAGYYVPWYEVEDNLHIDIYKGASGGSYKRVSYTVAEDNLLDLVASAGSRNRNEHKKVKEKPVIKKEKPVEIRHLPPCLIVDGYNMIYAWEEFAELARVDIQTARERLTDLIFNYQGYTGDLTILVFDGYRVKDNQGSVFTRGNMMVVYTKADVTADAYIEKATFDMRKRYNITVATSDGLVQNAAFAHGALRMSARELKGKIDLMNAFLAEKGVFSG
ncbi:MAG: NYN domain-containing protein, partial [Solobacterium sp.]|nr:NYN domain-containing protein [Solobacterium sp.]